MYKAHSVSWNLRSLSEVSAQLPTCSKERMDPQHQLQLRWCSQLLDAVFECGKLEPNFRAALRRPQLRKEGKQTCPPGHTLYMRKDWVF